MNQICDVIRCETGLLIHLCRVSKILDSDWLRRELKTESIENGCHDYQRYFFSDGSRK